MDNKDLPFTEEEFYEGLWERAQMVFTKEERQKLREARVGCIGLGGVGGIGGDMLVRSGVGSIVAVDPDHFELSNNNRQHYCTVSNIGKNKAEVGAARMLDINPFANVKVYSEGITPDNAAEIVKACDVIIDASDNKVAHYPLHRYAKEFRVPVMSRSHRVPDVIYGAVANVWDYRKPGVKTREELENSPTAKLPLDKIDPQMYKAKDAAVHGELNKVYTAVMQSPYAHNLLFTQNEPDPSHWEPVLARDKIVQASCWAAMTNMTGILLTTVAIGMLLDAKHLFLGPLTIRPAYLGDSPQMMVEHTLQHEIM